MTKGILLGRLPVYEGKQVLVHDDQDTREIIDEIINAHELFKKDYDSVANLFASVDTTSIAKKLFDFCKSALRFKAEPATRQTTRSPAAIVALDNYVGNDCKHFSLFIGGVLDALVRKGYKIDWCYRFVSYKLLSSEPTHVFVVIKLRSGEIFVDPVLELFNQRYPTYYHSKDKKPDMSLYRLSGVETTVVPAKNETMRSDCANLGFIGATTSTTTKGFDFNAILTSAIPVLLNFFTGLFGGGWQYSTGVRWLTQLYQFYVLSQGGVTSSNKVDENLTPTAQAWFATVFGIPFYDKYRFHAIKGTNPDNGQPLNITDQQKVQNYLNLGTDTKDIDPVKVMAAVQLAKKANFFPQTPGAWKFLENEAIGIDQSGSGSGAGDSGSGGGGSDSGPGVMDWIKENPVLTAVIVGGIGTGLYFALKPKRRRT